MKTCRACKNENADDANLCTGCGAPLTEMAAEAEVARMLTLQAQAKRKRRARNMAILVAALAGAVVLVIRSNQKQAQQKAVADFYMSVRGVYDSNVVEFWKCITRAAVTPQNNLQLTDSIETAFRKAPKGYLGHVRDRCFPMAGRAPDEMRAVRPPADAPDTLRGQIDGYATSLDGVKRSAQEFVDELRRMAETAQGDAKVIELANNYHAAEKDGPETYAYDGFLRCAVPGYDDMTDPQQVMEFLGTVYKEPVGHVDRWRKDCEPPLGDTALTQAHPKYKEKLEKFTPDTRDLSALMDIFKKRDQAQRKKLLEPIERSWFESAQSWEKLKAGIKEFLGEAKE